MFGENNIEIRLVGDTFDDCSIAAKQFTEENNMTFIPPFDDLRIIEGQGTVGVEILEDLDKIDYLFIPLGVGDYPQALEAILKLLPGNKNHRS
jgi:threonine dehydratase